MKSKIRDNGGGTARVVYDVSLLGGWGSNELGAADAFGGVVSSGCVWLIILRQCIACMLLWRMSSMIMRAA